MNKSIHAFVVLAYKESQYLEQCVKSVLRQDYKSDVVIATSTPNNFIRSIGKNAIFRLLRTEIRVKELVMISSLLESVWTIHY